MPFLKPKVSTVERLRQQAAAARAHADELDAQAKRHEFAELATSIISARASRLESLIAQSEKYGSQRSAISGRIGAAQRTVWELTTMLNNARAAVDEALADGDTVLSAQRSSHVGALTLALDRASQQLQSVQDEFDAVPTSTVDDTDRRNARMYREVSRSASKSAAMMQSEVTTSNDADIRVIGAEAQRNPGLLRTTTSPIRDMRTA